MKLRFFKTKSFQSDFEKTELTNDDLVETCKEIENGNPDASYGGLVYKQRIARPRQGKSGGYRAMITARLHDVFIFLYLFAKNERDNINQKEKTALKRLAAEFLKPKTDHKKLDSMVKDGTLIEIEDQADK